MRRVLAAQRVRQFDVRVPGDEVLRVPLGSDGQQVAQRLHQGCRDDADAILVALALADDQLVALQIVSIRMVSSC